MGDNDFPVQMAGGALGFGPMDLRQGLGHPEKLDEFRKVVQWRTDKLFPRPSLNPMAPENSEPLYTAMGAVQPEVTFGT